MVGESQLPFELLRVLTGPQTSLEHANLSYRRRLEGGLFKQGDSNVRW